MDLELSEAPGPLGTPADLARRCQAGAPGLVLIKPKVVFMKVEGALPGPTSMKLNVPSSGLGSVTLLEASVLVSLIKLIRPHKIFEFGTFLGYSTALLVENSADDCPVYSLDLGGSHVGASLDTYAEADLRRHGDINDAYLRTAQSALGPLYITGLAASDRARLHLLTQDSRQFDPCAHGLEGSVDLVFIDGGHDTETVTIDTANARRMIGDDGVIVWHDFSSNIHDDVTTFVNGLAGNEIIIHVQHTMLVMAVFGRAADAFLQAGV